MKVAYEKAIMETKEMKVSVPEDVAVGHALANTLKKKFESGEVRYSFWLVRDLPDPRHGPRFEVHSNLSEGAQTFIVHSPILAFLLQYILF